MKYTIILGCMLFGEGQGIKYDVYVDTIDEVKNFSTEEEASEYGRKILDNGGDSYYVYNENHKIRWGKGMKKRFKMLQKSV